MRSDYKRPPLMSRTKWTVLITVLALIIVLLLNAEYRSMQAPRWSEEAQIMAEVKQKASLASVDEAHKYVWDRTVWVTRGVNGSGEAFYIWYGDGKVLSTIPASEAQTAKSIRDRLLAQSPDVDITHSISGMINGEPAWELLYSRIENGARKYFYDFYDFRSGNLIETYRLPAKYST
ncbi:DUF5590 domain-containing protein [Paenibacillus beijingensis]|uniref:Cell wall elongation regulator TseB-like domain-containing protein n=1 Tax=Paenibacillus beijingensis TaxID=1126833 RepID=A0A0D5NPQ5_9BACL|nr:DUF5590 domain-containing protein [Paenibacillus beijingensis]AJY77130.1 hypothetical protein VN24_24520 [Paenibacillus beijingensis]